VQGQGVTGYILNSSVSLGSFSFVTGKKDIEMFSGEDKSSKVYYAVDNRVLGVFLVNNLYREGLNKTVSEFRKQYDVHLLSGDNENEKFNLSLIFKTVSNMHFNQSPEDKLNYILRLQSEGKRVLMIGDGLNDAGAIKQSDVGISVSEDISGFSPSCDGILDSESFTMLPEMISYSKMSMKIIYMSFAFSVLYNIVGLYFAVSGMLSPLFAAVLMPVSSVSVVLYCVLASNYTAKKKLNKKKV
jgi:Cu+-exporting ATPase